MKWTVALVLGIIVAEISRGDVGPDILEPLTSGDRTSIEQIIDRVTLARRENNRVAYVIVREAKIALGQIYETGWSESRYLPQLYEDTEKDWLVSVEKKAANNDPLFMSVMGWLCFNGYAGVEKDRQKAVTWWEKGAALNGGVAKLRLANCYSKGDVVPLDLQKAALLYREAGELGVPLGWYNLGAFYNQWQGMPQDIEKAMKYWEKSAVMGHAQSQYTVGVFYFEGKKVPQNLELGRKWLEAAAAQGHKQAKEYLKTHMPSNDSAHSPKTNNIGALH